MSTVSLVAVAKFLESAMGMGRTPIDSLRMLNEDEITAVVNEFLKTSGTQHTVMMAYPVDGNKIDAIKRVRAIITDCSLIDAKRFVEGYCDLTVTSQQLAELHRNFGGLRTR